MQRYSTVSYHVVKYVALFAISVVVSQSSDVPGEGRKPPKRYTETVTTKDGEKVSFEMILIPSGSSVRDPQAGFLMGSPKGEPGRKNDETLTRLRVLRPFMGT